MAVWPFVSRARGPVFCVFQSIKALGGEGEFITALFILCLVRPFWLLGGPRFMFNWIPHQISHTEAGAEVIPNMRERDDAELDP